jgi:hypothetical protein
MLKKPSMRFIVRPGPSLEKQDGQPVFTGGRVIQNNKLTIANSIIRNVVKPSKVVPPVADLDLEDLGEDGRAAG